MSADAPIAFGEFVLHPAHRCVYRGSTPIALRPKSYATLEHLVRRAGALVTKEELLDAVWRDTAVTDTVLKVCIRELREVLGDSPREPRFIETRHRVGYRFIAPAERQSPRKRPVPDSRPFVGREPELDRLLTLLDREPDERKPNVVIVSGESGMGKTWLLQELVSRASTRRRDLAWCVGRSIDQDGLTEPFHPFLDGLGDLAAGDAEVRAALEAHAPTWCKQLPGVFRIDARLRDATLGATRPRMARELRDALRELAVRRPLLCVLEDLHWADPSSVSMLFHLGTVCSDVRLLLVASVRPSAPALHEPPFRQGLLELETHGRCETIALGPLGREEVRRYASSVLDAPALPDGLVDALATRTEGHPLFLASLLEHLEDTKSIVRDQTGRVSVTLPEDQLARVVPPNIESLVERKLSSLAPGDRDLLAEASVQGITFLSDVLAETSGRPIVDVEHRLAELSSRHHLLRSPVEDGAGGVPSLRCAFTHAVYRDALYAAVTPSRRAQLHRTIGAVLERRAGGADTPPPIVLARHFELGHDPRRAIEHLVRAIEHAERDVASAEAEATCDRALALAERLAPAERAAVTAGLHKRRARLRIAVGRFAEASDDLASMRRLSAEAGDVALEIEALLLTFRQLGYVGRFADAEAIAREALRIAESRGSERDRAEILGALASLKGVQGALEPAAAGLREALAVLSAPRAARATLLLDLAGYGVMLGEYRKTLPSIDELVASARELGDALGVSAGSFWRALALGNDGKLGEALEVLHAVIRLSEKNDDVFVLPRQLAAIGWAHRELGAFDVALEWSRRAVDAAARGPSDGAAHAWIGVALDRLGAGDTSAAEEALDRVEAVLTGPCFSDWVVRTRLSGARARCALAMGRVDEASTHADAYVRAAATHGLHKHGAKARLLLAELALRRGDADAHRSIERELRASFAARPMPLLERRLEASCLRRSRQIGDVDGARRAETAKRQLAERLAAEAPPALRARFEALLDGDADTPLA